MTEPVPAGHLLTQYLAATLNGEPILGEGSADLDGKTVTHIDESETYTGIVAGPSLLPDFVWVQWNPTEGEPSYFGLHRPAELKEVDDENSTSARSD